MPDSLARIVPGLDKIGGRAHVFGMGIEWTESFGVWTARIEWAEIKVYWESGQWTAYSTIPPLKHTVGVYRQRREEAQREALRLLENALWGPVKALIAAREAVVGKLVLPESATKNEPRGRK